MGRRPSNGLDALVLKAKVRTMQMSSHGRLRHVAALMITACLSLPAAAQPWESAKPKPLSGLRPLIQPTPVPPSHAPEAAPARTADRKPTVTTQMAKPTTPEPKLAARLAPLTAPAPPRVVPPRPATATATARPSLIIIDSRRIADPQGGVHQLAFISDQLIHEFADRQAALDRLKNEVDAAQAELTAATPEQAKILDPKVKAQQAAFDAQKAAFINAYNARSSALVTPVQRQVNDALKVFATSRGAMAVIDRAHFNDSVLMLQNGVDHNALDLTTAFIDSYNAQRR